LLQGHVVWFEKCQSNILAIGEQNIPGPNKKEHGGLRDDMLVKSIQAAKHVDDLNEAFWILRKYLMKLNLSKCAFGVSSRKFPGFVVSRQGIEANLKKCRQC
jgi:hypothetical protein